MARVGWLGSTSQCKASSAVVNSRPTGDLAWGGRPQPTRSLTVRDTWEICTREDDRRQRADLRKVSKARVLRCGFRSIVASTISRTVGKASGKTTACANQRSVLKRIRGRRKSWTRGPLARHYLYWKGRGGLLGAQALINDQHEGARRELSIVLNVGVVGDLADAQLLDRFTSAVGESAERAFATLVGRHGPMVLATCRSVLRDSHAAQDAFQATFMVLARRAGSLRVQDSLGPWLHQVAYRTACCALAATERRLRHERKAALLTQPFAREEVRDDVGPVLHREIERLPERYRAVVLLCCMEGLTISQAALRLGWPAGTVQSRLARGRDRLRARLLRLGLAPSASLVGMALMPEPAQAAVPIALADLLARAALSASAGQMVAAGALSVPVITLMKGALYSMFVARIQKAAAVTVCFGSLALGAAVLAQIADHLNGAMPGPGAAAPTFKFEIRTWKDGIERGKPVVVEVSGGTSYNVATLDAVIQIRPRLQKDHPDRGLERPKEAERSSRPHQEGTNELKREMAAALDQFRLVLCEGENEQLRKEASERARVSGAERRLGRLEQKMDELLKALQNLPGKEIR
ncbi:MAG: RNA polymerase sigma factor [Isosphaeraceae bacterium]|nr:RNA polymerase sigma factor [Isosphaeraceae bacterium]